MKGGPKSSLRPFLHRALQLLYHFCVFQLLDVYGHKSNISLVFDFMETDLEVNV